MIPLKSLLKLERFPYINYFLILLNVVVFLYFYEHSSFFFLDYGVTPSKIGVPDAIIPFYEKVYPFFTYMFIHGSIAHLLINILFLYVFGGAVESKIGHGLYLCMYLIIGVLAAMAQVFASTSVSSPIIGSSGAIAGVMGMYLVFFPLAKIRTLVVIFLAEIYAVAIIGIWFAIQVFSIYKYNSFNGGVAFWAHIGGFAAGFFFAFLLRITKSVSK